MMKNFIWKTFKDLLSPERLLERPQSRPEPVLEQQRKLRVRSKRSTLCRPSFSSHFRNAPWRGFRTFSEHRLSSKIVSDVSSTERKSTQILF